MCEQGLLGDGCLTSFQCGPPFISSHGADWPQVLDGSQWHRQAINQYETYDPLLSLVLSLDDGKATGCLPMF